MLSPRHLDPPRSASGDAWAQPKFLPTAAVAIALAVVAHWMENVPNVERAAWGQVITGFLSAVATLVAVLYAANANRALRAQDSVDAEKERRRHAAILAGMFRQELFDSACRLYEARLFLADAYEPKILADILHRWAAIKLPVLQARTATNIEVFDLPDGILFGTVTNRLVGVQLMGELNMYKVDYWAPSFNDALWQAAAPVVEDAYIQTRSAYDRTTELTAGHDELAARFVHIDREYPSIRAMFEAQARKREVIPANAIRYVPLRFRRHTSAPRVEQPDRTSNV